jgi:hypothetical protein
MNKLKESPRSRLVALCELLGMPVDEGFCARGGQVTKAFFLEVALRLKIKPETTLRLEKTRLSAVIAEYLGVSYDKTAMSSRGARVSNVWFDAVIERMVTIRAAMPINGSRPPQSVLCPERLAAHLVSEARASKVPRPDAYAACYVCGDVPGDRLGVEVIEVHSMDPYETVGLKPSSHAFCLVCPSCHSALHRLGIQAKAFRRRLRP